MTEKWQEDLQNIMISAKDDFFLWEEAGVFYFKKMYMLLLSLKKESTIFQCKVFVSKRKKIFKSF